jgi:peptidoglycan/LPS O-acetylase OafA/YrhL
VVVVAVVGDAPADAVAAVVVVVVVVAVVVVLVVFAFDVVEEPLRRPLRVERQGAEGAHICIASLSCIFQQ